MKVVFRVDASFHIGSGHLMRCLTLAEALKERGTETQFICADFDGNLNAFVQSKGFSIKVLPKTSMVDAFADAELTILALGTDKPDWIVVDHYGLDLEWERRVKPFAKKLLAIDDYAGRSHDCDILLDQNFSQEGPGRYEGLIPSSSKMLLGPDFALLRKEFGELREQASLRHRLENLLVFLTAGDDQGETLKAIRGIEMFGRIKGVDVVVGRSNQHKVQIKQKCDQLHWEFHCQVDYMSSLIVKADLVIGAGGSSNWERCALGAPALVTILAGNQIPISQALDRAGVIRNLGWFNALKPSDYADALNSLNSRQLADMSLKAREMVDAAGAERVANHMSF